MYDGPTYYAKYGKAIQNGLNRAKERRDTLRKQLVESLGGKCVDCGYSKCISVLQFDHVDPTTKSKPITALLTLKNPIKALEEVKKCVLRCANCHWEKTIAAGEIGRKRKYVY